MPSNDVLQKGRTGTGKRTDSATRLFVASLPACPLGIYVAGTTLSQRLVVPCLTRYYSAGYFALKLWRLEPKLTKTEEDLLWHMSHGYQLETSSMWDNPILRNLKDNSEVRATANRGRAYDGALAILRQVREGNISVQSGASVLDADYHPSTVSLSSWQKSNSGAAPALFFWQGEDVSGTTAVMHFEMTKRAYEQKLALVAGTELRVRPPDSRPTGNLEQK